MKTHENVNEDILCNFNEAESGGVDKVDFDAVINKSPLTVNFNTSLEYVLDIFAKLGARYLLVEKEGCLVGIITRKDVLRYEYTVHEHNRDNVQQANHDAFDEKVWEFINLIGTSAKRILVKYYIMMQIDIYRTTTTTTKNIHVLSFIDLSISHDLCNHYTKFYRMLSHRSPKNH